jgi:hypothetical protein
MSEERLKEGEACEVSISAGLRPIHKKAIVTSVKPKGYDVLCEGETTERHISEKKAKRLPGRKATASLEIQKYTVREQPLLTYADIKEAAATLEANSIKPDEDGIVMVPLVCTECHKYIDRCPRCGRVKAQRPSVELVARSTKPQPKPRPRWRSAEYLKFVGEHDCCGCGAPAPSDAHHWGGSQKGMGLKIDDARTCPVCRRCHDCFHSTGRLPGFNKDETIVIFLRAQVTLLVEWVCKEYG